MRTALCALLLALAASGCASRPSAPEVIYVPVPEGYLQPCELPASPRTEGEYEVAFVQAYLCGEQGNRDKERIRNLPRNAPASRTD